MAIAYITSVDGGLGNPVTSHNWNHVIAPGSDRCLLVGFFAATTDIVTGVTADSVPATLVGKTSTGGDRWVYLYRLVAPNVTTNNIVVSLSGADAIYGYSANYTGVDQTTPIDAFNTGNDVGLSGSHPVSVVPSTNNTWSVMITRLSSGGGPQTAGAGTTLRQATLSGLMFSDSNGPITPAGSNSLTVNDPLSGNWASVIASLRPSIPARFILGTH